MQITVSLMVEIPASADINEIETRVQTAGRAAMRQAVQQAVRAWEKEHSRCPHCGSELGRSAGTRRRVIQTSFGRIDLALSRRRCQSCGRRFRPAESCLRTLAAGQVTAQLRHLSVLAGASWAYQTATGVIADLCGSQLSAETIRQLTNEAGQAEAQRQAAQAYRLVEPTAQQVREEREPDRGSSGKPKVVHRLLVGMDGGWIGSREQKGGMEGKVAVLASEVEPVGKQGRHRLSQRRYVATFRSSAQLGQLAYAAVCQLQAEQAEEQVVLADGADWIGSECELHFPDAVKILDWPHLWRKVHRGMRALHPGKSKAQRAWRKQQYERLKPLLWHGQVEEALNHLRTLRPGSSQEPIKAFEELVTYVENQRQWIGNYEQWQQQGYPIGSGLVEREVALVINRRMKRQGMRWKRANADAVVALRVQRFNADWEVVSLKRRPAS